MIDKDYMTPAEVCEYLQISRWTLNDMIRRGQFAKEVVISCRVRRWRKDDIDAWSKLGGSDD